VDANTLPRNREASRWTRAKMGVVCVLCGFLQGPDWVRPGVPTDGAQLLLRQWISVQEASKLHSIRGGSRGSRLEAILRATRQEPGNAIGCWSSRDVRRSCGHGKQGARLARSPGDAYIISLFFLDFSGLARSDETEASRSG